MGSHFSTPENRYISSTEMTNTGTEMPIVANTMQAMSTPLPRYTADSMPSGRPISSDATTAMAPTCAETGKWLPMIWLTVVSVFL